MPDITMCKGTGCPIRDDCYRYYAKPSEFYQSYFSDVPYNHEVKGCSEHWKRHEREARIHEVFDDSGGMVRLEAYDAETNMHIIDGLWDPSEENTPKNRQAFRDWFGTQLLRKGIKPIN